MGARFIKTVKSARRGISLTRRMKHRLLVSLLLFLGLLGGSAFLVWWQERGFEGSYWDSMWSVLFTLIGQGEFAESPRTILGRVVVFLLSVFGVALFGVVFAEVLQRLINSRLKEMLGMSRCKFEGHAMICGWNGRGPHLVRHLAAAGKPVAVVAEERPKELPGEVFFVQGNPSDHDALIRGGIEKAQSAIILWDPRFGEDDSRTILTGLAVESIRPEVYTVMELHNPENARYARYAHVDDLLYTDSLIADITGICANYEGISSFIRDILSTADDGHSFASFDAPAGFATVGELFGHFRDKGLPVGVLVPGAEGDWVSRVNPSPDEPVTLPMKVVCLVKNQN